MNVSPDEVRAMAALASLRLDDEEAGRLAGDLNRILSHVDRLQALDPGEVLARAELTEQGPGSAEESQSAPAEEGEAAPAQENEAAPAIPDRLHASPEEHAPAWDHGFFLVPPPEGVDPDAS